MRHLAQKEEARQDTNSKSYKSLKNRGHDAQKSWKKMLMAASEFLKRLKNPSLSNCDSWGEFQKLSLHCQVCKLDIILNTPHQKPLDLHIATSFHIPPPASCAPCRQSLFSSIHKSHWRQRETDRTLEPLYQRGHHSLTSAMAHLDRLEFFLHIQNLPSVRSQPAWYFPSLVWSAKHHNVKMRGVFRVQSSLSVQTCQGWRFS